MNWTEEQKKVIELRNRDILVSAAAGSGKTAVLVERIIGLITKGENPPDIDSLLVVTFTRAAASEMRERIGAAIDRLCEQYPENAHMRRQSALVHNAMITTIDSFCLFVVRNHFEEIGLDPNFRIADTGEIKLLEQDVLKQVFEENYTALTPSFLKLVDTYGNKRSDRPLKDMVEKIYRMSLSSPWPAEWVEKLTADYQVESVEELEQTPLLMDLTEHVQRMVQDLCERERALLVLSRAEDGPGAYEKTLEEDIAMLEKIQEISDYSSLESFFEGLSFGKLSAIRKFEGDAGKKDAVQSGRNGVKKELEGLKKKYFAGNLQELFDQLMRLRPVVEELVRLTLQYMEAMEQAKRKKRIVDFSDIEHFALEILVDEKTKKPRMAAEEFRAHFTEIMIDEYQDSNQVQEEILRAISREKEGRHNLFMVGDVKQSIYRFRLARPELFMEKYASFSREDGLQQRIDLHKNFRSRREVIDFCNDIFYKIMSPDLGKVSYDEEAALYCGAEYPECSGMETELLLVDEGDPFFEGQEMNKRQLEAHMTANRIRRLMEETRVTDRESGQLRNLRYSDIVILLRSIRDWGTDFVRVLSEHGIPAHVESSTGYFSAMEVQTVLAMLKILDNPYQDIPMAAVLKSPMAGLDDEEMAQIRVDAPELSFAEAAYQKMQEEEEGPLHDFYVVYRKLRDRRELPVHELIQNILDETGYGNYAASLPAGQQRAANLEMLIEKAVDFEKTSYRGLFHFLRYMEQLQTYEIDFGEADQTGENADVVRIMTIHKSKGLEFPVVFVSGLSKMFNQMDARETMVVHPDLGLGICEISGSPKVKTNCVFRSEIADRIRRENLGEELRVLYVALTRGKEKLILTGTIKDEEKTISKVTGNVHRGQPVSYSQRVSAASYLDWILPAMLSYPDKYTVETIDPAQIVWDAVENKADRKMDYEELLGKIEQADPALVSRYGERLSYCYPYQQDVSRKSKYSVSELKHASMVLSYDRREGESEVPEFLLEEKDRYIPSFAEKGEKEKQKDAVNPGALRGTAVHRVMECLDFEALSGVDQRNREEVKEFVRKELLRMLACGDLTREDYDLVAPWMLESFVQNPVAERMALAAGRGDLYREKPFVMEHEGVLVQGIIDVFWMEEDSIVLLDYKTDRVKSGDELVLRYKTQLDLYADALTRVFSTETKKKRAEEKLIYSFCLKEVLSL